MESLFKDCLNIENLKIQVEALKTPDIPAVLLMSEQSRRMQEMTRYFGNSSMGSLPAEHTLVLNKKNSLIEKLSEIKDNEDRKQDVDLICRHVYDLAMLSHDPWSQKKWPDL